MKRSTSFVFKATMVTAFSLLLCSCSQEPEGPDQEVLPEITGSQFLSEVSKETHPETTGTESAPLLRWNFSGENVYAYTCEQKAETTQVRIDALCEVRVTDAQYEAFLAKLLPIGDDNEKRTNTMRNDKRDQLWTMFQTDPRCEPHGTAWAALQANNTFNHWNAVQRKSGDRDVRNMQNAINGNFAKSDDQSLRLLSRIVERELVAA